MLKNPNMIINGSIDYHETPDGLQISMEGEFVTETNMLLMVLAGTEREYREFSEINRAQTTLYARSFDHMRGCRPTAIVYLQGFHKHPEFEEILAYAQMLSTVYDIPFVFERKPHA